MRMMGILTLGDMTTTKALFDCGYDQVYIDDVLLGMARTNGMLPFILHIAVP